MSYGYMNIHIYVKQMVSFLRIDSEHQRLLDIGSQEDLYKKIHKLFLQQTKHDLITYAPGTFWRIFMLKV